MAESAAEKLKRILAEKQAAKKAAQVQETASESVQVTAGAETPRPVEASDSQHDANPAPVETSTQLVRTEQSVAHSGQTSNKVPAPLAPTHELEEKIKLLQHKLTDQIPDFPYLLKEIHEKLRDDPEICTILSDDEIGVIVTGLSTHKDITIVNAPKTSKKRTQPVTVDMLD